MSSNSGNSDASNSDNNDKISVSLIKLREILSLENINLLTKSESFSSIDSSGNIDTMNVVDVSEKKPSKSKKTSQDTSDQNQLISTANTKKLILISYERLKSLEKLEKGLPEMIRVAIDENKKSNLKRLHEKDKLDPKSVNARVKKYVLKHKDKINAKRREKRKEAKLILIQQKAISAELENKALIETKPENTIHDTNDVGDKSDSDKSITVRFDD